jgi:hypothetical protein
VSATNIIPTGFCQCGCGSRTTIAKQSVHALGIVRGEPRRFLPAHHHRVRPRQQQHEVRDCGYDTPCWVWLLYRDRDGYGIVTLDGKRRKAHRVNYEAKYGPIPEGLVTDHLCANRSCVNPDHVEPVTNAVNIRRGRNAKLTSDDVAEMRASYAAGRSTREIADAFGFDRKYVWEVVTERVWSAA